MIYSLNGHRKIQTSATWLTVIGLGEDGVAGITESSQSLISNAELVVGGKRHLELVEELIFGQRMAWSSPLSATLPQLLAWRGRRVVVLASGDPLFYGIGTTLRRHVAAQEILFIPQPSCASLAAARIGWTQQEIPTVSLGGRPLESLRPVLQPGRGVFVLSATGDTPARVANALVAWGFGDSVITVFEALGGARESIYRYSARELAATMADFAPLNMFALEVKALGDARIIPYTPGLPDDWFEHDGQITKREVRAVTLSNLRPEYGRMLWDVGCGSGSIAIEWLLAHPATHAVAIERCPARADRAARNAAALGVPRLDIRTGEAPQIFAELPPPDVIFFGGGLRTLSVLEAAWSILPAGGRLVANAVAVETEQLLIEAWQRYGGSLTRLTAERLDSVGDLHAFRPAMKILQWVAMK